MVTFHAPMVAMDLARGLSEASKAHFWSLLMGEMSDWKINLGEVIRHGKVESEMMGGCLSILVTTLGTPYEIDTRGKLLFLEDVGEKPYRVERMLTHLKMAGKFDDVAGVLFGDFTDCDGDGPRGIREVVIDMFRRRVLSRGYGNERRTWAGKSRAAVRCENAIERRSAKLEMLEPRSFDPRWASTSVR